MLPLLYYFIISFSATNLLDYHKKSTVPLNYVILEVIFSQLFRIPDSPIRPIFYGSLLIELCKTKTMPQVGFLFPIFLNLIFFGDRP